MSLFRRCPHEWEMLSKETLPSAFETMIEAMTKAGMGLTKLASGPACQRTLVQIVTCKKCGALKHFRDEAA